MVEAVEGVPLVKRFVSDIELPHLLSRGVIASVSGISSLFLSNEMLGYFNLSQEIHTILITAAGITPPIAIHAKWYFWDKMNLHNKSVRNTTNYL